MFDQIMYHIPHLDLVLIHEGPREIGKHGRSEVFTPELVVSLRLYCIYM